MHLSLSGAVLPLAERFRFKKLVGLMSMSGLGSLRQSSESETPAHATGEGANAHCKRSLLGVIESQIIPRLLESHALASASNEGDINIAFNPNDAEVTQFAKMCLTDDAETCITFVEGLLAQNIGADAIFLNLIAPTARRLGLMWEDDRVDFMQVTMGLLKMHQITHRLGYEYQDGPKKAGDVRRIMLASAPGSQHILGLAMVSEFFRKDGWQVVVEVATTERELLHAVGNEWFDLVGLSVGLVEQIPTLPGLIGLIHQSSRNPQTKFILGGPAFLMSKANAESLGAHAISTDAAEAIKQAAQLVVAPPSPD
jgi:methanogenic corrinoid protein MtbC1